MQVPASRAPARQEGRGPSLCGYRNSLVDFAPACAAAMTRLQQTRRERKCPSTSHPLAMPPDQARRCRPRHIAGVRCATPAGSVHDQPKETPRMQPQPGDRDPECSLQPSVPRTLVVSQTRPVDGLPSASLPHAPILPIASVPDSLPPDQSMFSDAHVLFRISSAPTKAMRHDGAEASRPSLRDCMHFGKALSKKPASSGSPLQVLSTAAAESASQTQQPRAPAA